MTFFAIFGLIVDTSLLVQGFLVLPRLITRKGGPHGSDYFVMWGARIVGVVGIAVNLTHIVRLLG